MYGKHYQKYDGRTDLHEAKVIKSVVGSVANKYKDLTGWNDTILVQKPEDANSENHATSCKSDHPE